MSSVESVLYQRVQQYAAYHDFDTAIFMAEQLFAAFKQQQQQQQTQLSAILASYAPTASYPQPAANPALLHPLVILLAQCYIHSGPSDLPRAYHLLSSTLTALCPSPPALRSECEPQHRYLLALVCSRLDKLQEAELCLLPLLSHPSFSSLPSAASSLSLLGVVCQRTGRVDEAVRYHSRALELDGMLWSSYAALCQLGVKANVSSLFTVDAPTSTDQPPVALSSLPALYLHSSASDHASSNTYTPQPSSQHATAASTAEHANQLSSTVHSTAASAASTPRPKPPHTRVPSAASSSLKGTTKRSTATPTTSTTPLSSGQQRLTFQTTKLKKDGSTTTKPAAKPYNNSNKAAVGAVRNELTETSGRMAPHSRTKSWSSITPLAGMVRKRLDEIADMEAAESGGVGGGLAEEGVENEQKEDRGAAMDAVDGAVAAVAGLSASPPPSSTQPSDDDAGDEQFRRHEEMLRRSAASYTSLFRTLACAHAALSLCHPRTCIRLLSTLSFERAHSPFALQSLARAHFDLVDYPTALRYWQQLRTLHPHHVHTLDLYSTALWQCKRDTLLASLAHSLTPHHANQPSTAIVLGNTFSLQREHDTALRFFRRAVQLDPHYAYGWVLIGHECVVLEEWDRAVEAYRRAIGEDGRMYGGWYGLGQVYYQQEKWQAALYHFTRALSINSQSPLLRVYVAMTLVQLQRLDDALTVLLELDAVQQTEDELAAAAVAIVGSAQPPGTERTAQPIHPQVQYQIANIHVLNENWQAALQACERLEAAVWREASVYVLMGRVYRALNDVDGAMRCWVLALELDVKDSNGVKGMMEAMCKREMKRTMAVARGEQLVDEVEEQEMDVGY